MARARNIKPGFFTNEVLAELSLESRLLFIGLWTIADKAGRLHDRPKRIKMQVFPLDSIDVDPVLEQLAKAGFIWRYEVDEGKYIQIVNWDKHQNPHHREKESDIPAPVDRRSVNAGNHFDDSDDKPEASAGKAEASTGNAGSSRADSLILRFSDTGFSDSLIDEKPPTTAADLSKELRSHGFQCQPADPRLMTAAEQGVSVETLRAACITAKEKKPGERLPFTYVLKIVESWAADATRLKVAGAQPRASPYQSVAERTAAIGQALTGANRERKTPDMLVS